MVQSREVLKWGCQVIANNGKKARFWDEIWAGTVPLKLEFPSLYHLCSDRGCLIGDIWVGDSWKVDFRRPLGLGDMKEWDRMMVLLENYSLNDSEDTFTWVLDKSGKYSTRSMYRRLTFRGVINRRMQKLWRSKLPQKLKVFLWFASQDRLQTGLNLKKKNWKGNAKCCLCGVLENMDHIFFRCHVARVIWFCFKEALGWERSPMSFQDFLDNWLPLGSKNYHVKLFAFPSSSNEVFYKIFHMLQKWRILLKDQDGRFLDDKVTRMKKWLLDF